jgi:hypothetical protein
MSNKQVLACLLFFVVVEAQAATATLTWTQPTTATDGSALTGAAVLTSNRVEWGSCNGTAFGTKSGEKTLTPPATTTTVTVGTGTWCFRVYATNANGESGPSNVAQKVVVPPPPNPPSSLTVSNLTAYAVVKQVDKFVMTPVGTVPAATACITDQYVNGYYVVPRAAVTWSGTVKPDVVVAECSAG